MLNQTQVEEIARVPGIDVLFIGPWDLGNNIGRPVLGAFHDDLNAAIDRIFKAAVDNGKRVGIYCTGGEPAKKYADQGFHMVTKTFFLSYLYSPADTSRSPSLPMLWPSQHSFPTHCKPPKVPSPSHFTASMQSIPVYNQDRNLLLVCLVHQRFHLLLREPMEQLLRIRQSLLARRRLYV